MRQNIVMQGNSVCECVCVCVCVREENGVCICVCVFVCEQIIINTLGR